MKKPLIVAAFAVLLVAGCGQSAPAKSGIGNPDGFSEVHYRLGNGRTVTCLLYANGVGSSSVAGLSCDWVNTK